MATIRRLWAENGGIGWAKTFRRHPFFFPGEGKLVGKEGKDVGAEREWCSGRGRLVPLVLPLSPSLAQSPDRIELPGHEASLPLPPGWVSAPDEVVEGLKGVLTEATGIQPGLAAILSPSESEAWGSLPHILVFANRGNTESVSRVRQQLGDMDHAGALEGVKLALAELGGESPALTRPIWDSSSDILWTLGSATSAEHGPVEVHSGAKLFRDGSIQVCFVDSRAKSPESRITLLKGMLSDLQVPQGRSFLKRPGE